jgi:hypothetical protein
MLYFIILAQKEISSNRAVTTSSSYFACLTTPLRTWRLACIITFSTDLFCDSHLGFPLRFARSFSSWVSNGSSGDRCLGLWHGSWLPSSCSRAHRRLPFRLDSGWHLTWDGSYILGSHCNLTAMAAFQYDKMSLMKSIHSACTRKSQMVAIYR